MGSFLTLDVIMHFLQYTHLKNVILFFVVWIQNSPSVMYLNKPNYPACQNTTFPSCIKGIGLTHSALLYVRHRKWLRVPGIAAAGWMGFKYCSNILMWDTAVVYFRGNSVCSCFYTFSGLLVSVKACEAYEHLDR